MFAVDIQGISSYEGSVDVTAGFRSLSDVPNADFPVPSTWIYDLWVSLIELCSEIFILVASMFVASGLVSSFVSNDILHSLSFVYLKHREKASADELWIILWVIYAVIVVIRVAHMNSFKSPTISWPVDDSSIRSASIKALIGTFYPSYPCNSMLSSINFEIPLILLFPSRPRCSHLSGGRGVIPEASIKTLCPKMLGQHHLGSITQLNEAKLRSFSYMHYSQD
jgi:hypothetical protein